MPAAVQSWSTGSSGALTTSTTVPKPSGTVAGDLLLALVTTFNTTPTAVTVDGVAATKVGGLNTWIRAWNATGSEPNPITVARTGTNSTALAVILFRIDGHDATTPVDFATLSQGLATNVTLASGTASTAGLLLSAVFKTGNISPTLTPPTGMASVFYDDTTTASAQAAASLSVSAGATGSKVWTSATNVQSAGFLLLIRDGITNTPVAVDAVGEGLASESRAVVAAKTSTAAGEGLASLTLAVNYARSLTATGEGIGSQGRGLAFLRTLDAVGEGTATVGRALTVTVSGTGEGAATSAKATTATRSFTATGEGAASELHPVQAVRSFDVTGSGAASGSIDVPLDGVPNCPGDWPVNDGERSIAGVVRHHETGDPLDGATLTLFRDGDDLPVATTVSAGGGAYTFPRDTTDPFTYWVLARYDDLGTQVHGVSDSGRTPS